ncbi:hypothetical protein PtA15_17A193 [Puccinia triticina]|uniref:Uncharacterized protein n=1 Tax=Puccinia triticina TaxID=208348 RepID=A0ABY7D8Q9_9BASI|nr:uncharacterized protein PtA15_17A193 [Puccinia triticina]WAQ92711.1 hypothetical protein PtA15_17A193 [Puccinia triticina]WAR63606.1 hypothetical protein PtB15_17B206 [Puccinia triticina]
MANAPLSFSPSSPNPPKLAAILKNQVIRTKNVLSSLQLRTLGPTYEVLLALGDAIKIQPNVLLHELKFLGLATNTAGLL